MRVGRTIRGEGTPRPWTPAGHFGICGTWAGVRGGRVVAQVMDARDRDVILRAVNDYETMRDLLDRLVAASHTETIELRAREVARKWEDLTQEEGAECLTERSPTTG